MMSALAKSTLAELVVAYVLLLLPTTMNAQFEYTNESGNITITGYNGTGGDVVIPPAIDGFPVRTVGNWAFQFCASVTSITLGTNVITVGTGAFSGCSGLTNISVDPIHPRFSSVDGVLFDKSGATLFQCPGGRIGVYAVPATVIVIADAAFLGCGKLSGVMIGTNVASVGNGAFNGCSTLTNIMLPATVTNIGASAFYYCTSLTNFAIPDGITAIGNYMFAGCQALVSIAIPDTVTSIGNYTFNQCYSLVSVSIGNSVTNIGNGPFQSCTNLTAVTIPASVTSIGELAFYDCTRLMRVYFAGNAPNVGPAPFYDAAPATIYHVPGTTGWSDTLGGRPTVLWNPQFTALVALTDRTISCVVTGTPGIPVALEASANLISTGWVRLQTTNLVTGALVLTDPRASTMSTSFYRSAGP
jgi:hypothetical protein